MTNLVNLTIKILISVKGNVKIGFLGFMKLGVLSDEEVIFKVLEILELSTLVVAPEGDRRSPIGKPPNGGVRRTKNNKFYIYK